MTATVLRLAACSRALVHQLRPGQTFDENEVFAGWLSPHEAEIKIFAETLGTGVEFDAFGSRCLDVLNQLDSLPHENAVKEADALAEGAVQQSDVPVIVGGIVTMAFLAALITMLIAVRIKRIRAGTLEVDFYEGVPKGAQLIAEKLVDKIPDLQDLLPKDRQ